MSRVLDLADAVVSALNARTFATPFTAARRVLPLSDADLLAAGLVVTVRPGPVAVSQETRATNAEDLAVEIAVEAGTKAAETDAPAMMNLAEAIMDALDRSALVITAGVARQVSAELVPYDPETLRSARIVMALITVTFRLFHTPNA